MRTRTIQTELLALAADFPVVAIYGPRQTGKTTLARMAFPSKPWISLEDPDILSAATHDPRGFLADFPDGAIFDEIQRAPHLLSYLQGIVDADRRPGRYILTGSHQARLRRGVAQSLAGRTAVLTLLPYSLEEAPVPADAPRDAFAAIRRGFYPQLRETAIRPERFFPSYVATYLERDLPSLLAVRDAAVFRDFLFLLASRTGQIVNHHALSADLGVSAPTVKAWISALEESGLVFRLRGWSRNAVSQVVKSPKIYFTDTGLAAWLARLRTDDLVAGSALRGGLYENLVVAELLKRSLSRMDGDAFWFYRDSRGREVDLVLERAGRLIPVEIKSAATFDPSFADGILHFRSVFPEAAPGIIFFNGSSPLPAYKGIRLANILRGAPCGRASDK